MLLEQLSECGIAGCESQSHLSDVNANPTAELGSGLDLVWALILE